MRLQPEHFPGIEFRIAFEVRDGASEAIGKIERNVRVTGAVDGLPGLHSIERHPDARTFPDLTLYRFDAPLTFFNSDYFRTRVLAVAGAAGPQLRWFVIDAIPISRIDLTGLYALRDLREILEARGTVLMLAGRKTGLLDRFREAGLYRPEHERWILPTLRQALKSCQREQGEEV